MRTETCAMRAFERANGIQWDAARECSALHGRLELFRRLVHARAKRSVCEIRKQMKNKGKRKSKLKHQAS